MRFDFASRTSSSQTNNHRNIMPKSKFVDFKAVKSAVTMEQVLEHYGLLDKFKRGADSLSGPCPIHKGSNPTQFRVSISKNIWNCFSECKHGGNTLDFIARMDDVSIHAAALKAIEWFQLDPESISANEDKETPSDVPKSETIPAPAPKKAAPPTEKSAPNTPLKFRLDKLERSHPYLAERGLTLETIVDFGIGFCAKGMMADRIAIPIHNVKGEVVAYAGRFPGEPAEDIPKYKLPQGFRKSQELFNIDRVAKQPQTKPLIIVEGFFDCMKLHQLGCTKVVALMGSSLSAAQEQLIKQYTHSESRIIVMLDENEAGRAGRDDIACRLSKFCFVRVHELDQPDMEPEHLTPEQVQQLCL
jgi:DNA primase